jgi:hypothetical protein
MPLLLVHTVSDSEEDDMDDEDYREVCYLSIVSLFLSNSENCLDLNICLPMILLQLLTFQLFFTDLILTIMVTESNRCMQQVISRKWAMFRKNCTRITMYEMKGFLACNLNMGMIKIASHSIIVAHSLLPSYPWFGKMFTMHHFSLLAALLPPRQ